MSYVNIFYAAIAYFQDDDEEILKRAKEYKIPNTEVRPLHFAYQCIFGFKEPIFSEEHLRLCDDNALIELKSDIPPYCVPIWLRKSRKGLFHVSFQVKEFDGIGILFCIIRMWHNSFKSF